ncbi:hypothetical protein, partial [Luteimonas suaedae]|uniref:hypothetical protein n=1 Tax=Luteimonas suaedae TaxID=2605430 RepID=UPI001CA838CF
MRWCAREHVIAPSARIARSRPAPAPARPLISNPGLTMSSISMTSDAVPAESPNTRFIVLISLVAT